MIKKLLLTLLLTVILISLTGCQTIEGFGRDLEWIGQQMGQAVE